MEMQIQSAAQPDFVPKKLPVHFLACIYTCGYGSKSNFA